MKIPKDAYSVEEWARKVFKQPRGKKPMPYEMKEGQISVFKNEGKTEEKHPDFDCSIMVNGEVQKYGLWWRESKKGQKYLGGKRSDYQAPSEQKANDDWSFN